MPSQPLDFLPDRDSELFAAAPASSAVFVLRGDQGTEPYIGKTSNLRRRLQRLLGIAEGQSRKLNLRDRVRRVEWTATGSDFEASFLLYKIQRREFPATYDKRLRLRFAPLVKLILDNPYPRAIVTHSHQQHEEQCAVLRPVPDARCGGSVRQRLARSLQDAALRRRSSIPIPPFPAAFIPR